MRSNTKSMDQISLRPPGHAQGLPIGNRYLLAAAMLDMQLLEAVEPFNIAIVVDDLALTQF
jgi:hypothetical protein